jgi:hypothetical protein
MFYPVFGAIVTNAATWTIALLVNFHVDPTLANAGGVIVGAAIGGAHQGLAWKTDPPSAPVIIPASPVLAPDPAPAQRTLDPALTDAPNP